MFSALFFRFFEVSTSAGLLVLLCLCFTPVFRRFFSPTWKYWLWLFFSIRLLVPFGAGFTALLFSPEQLAGFFSRYSWVAWAWLGGGAFIALVCLLSYISFRRQCIRWSVPPTSSQTQEVVQHLCERLKLSPIPVLISMEVSSPLVIGLTHPLLFLPHEHYSEEDIGYVLRHELLHYKRRDVWYKLLLLAASIVHWFNPIVWIMYFQAVCDLEALCDAKTLQKCSAAQRLHYSNIITNTNHAPVKKSVCTTHFYGGSVAIRGRLSQIADSYTKKSGLLVLIPLIVLCLTVGMLPTAYSSNAFLQQLSTVMAETTPPPLDPAASALLPTSSSEASSSEVSSSEVSSSEASSSEASSSEASSSEASSSEVSSSEVSSSEASSSEASIVKQAGVVPEKSYFLSTVQSTIRSYQDGTADTSMNDPEKPLLMPAPAGVELPSLQNAEEFSVSTNQQGYGIIISLAGGRYMHIWVKDIGPSDAYQFEVTAVSFTS